MKPVSNNIQDYLKPSVAIDWQHPDIIDYRSDRLRQRAKQITVGLDDDIARAQSLFEWVRDKIPHSRDIDADIVTFTASEVLAQGTGICYAKSHLLAAMCRSIGIPAGLCYQTCANDPPDINLVLHGLNAIYLAQIDRWIRVDPRGNTGKIDAQFSLTEERLAFPPNPDFGEFIYAEIWREPVPEIVEALTKFTSRREMWSHLPAEIQGQ
jgi:transglutaminase-like putative cysteine protease